MNFTYKIDPRRLLNESRRLDFNIEMVSLRHLLQQPSNKTVTHNFTTSDSMILISREPHTQFKKFLLPSDTEVWVCLLVTFFIGDFVIFVVKLLKKPIQNFVFGLRVKTPFMNFL